MEDITGRCREVPQKRESEYRLSINQGGGGLIHSTPFAPVEEG